MPLPYTPAAIAATSPKALERGQSALWDSMCDASQVLAIRDDTRALWEEQDAEIRRELNDADISDAVAKLSESGEISAVLSERIEAVALEFTEARLRFAGEQQ